MQGEINMRKRNHYPVAAFLLLLALLFGGCSYNQPGLDTQAIQENTQKSYELTDIPAYAGNSFVITSRRFPKKIGSGQMRLRHTVILMNSDAVV